MRIEINAVRIELTDALKEYVNIKIGGVGKLLKRFEEHGEVVAFIEISRTSKHHKRGEVYYAEATMKLPQKTIRIERVNEDVRAAVDELKDALKEAVSELKERQLKRK